jgi:hypothetical protein
MPEDDAASIVARAASLAERRRVMARPACRLEPRPLLEEQAQGSPAGGGISGGAGPWRSALHRALAAAANGASRDVLRGVCRVALFDGRAHDGANAELDELLAFTAAVRASAIWARGEAAERRVVGVPFAIRLPADEARAICVTDDQRGVSSELATDCDTLVEGVLDLAFRRLGKWTVVDCGTFATRDASAAADVARCRRRLDLYAACWERITGEPVELRVVTSLDEEIEW